MFYDFNPNLPEPLNVIHPLQVKAIQKFIANANKFPDNIKYIILFGSSLSLACHPNSDLDLYAVIDYNGENYDEYIAVCQEIQSYLYNLCQTLNKRFDILVFSSEHFKDALQRWYSVESKIMQRGVVIYEKK